MKKNIWSTLFIAFTFLILFTGREVKAETYTSLVNNIKIEQVWTNQNYNRIVPIRQHLRHFHENVMYVDYSYLNRNRNFHRNFHNIPRNSSTINLSIEIFNLFSK
jgi:hypothetical protein